MKSSSCFIFYFSWLTIRGQPNQEERQQVILLRERHLSFVGSREEPKCHQCKFADWIRLDPNLISRHRVEKSPRTDNKGFIVLKNPNHNNRQSLIRYSSGFPRSIYLAGLTLECLWSSSSITYSV